MSSSHRILQTEQVHQPFPQWPRSDTVCSAPQRRHFGFGVISTFLTSVSGIKYSLLLYRKGRATKTHKILGTHPEFLHFTIRGASPNLGVCPYAASAISFNV